MNGDSKDGGTVYSKTEHGSMRILAMITAAALCGCGSLEKLPPGTQLQSSTLGLKFSPGAVDGTPLVFGSHTIIATTAQPIDGGANLNRFAGEAPGVKVHSTVASGTIGEQINAAGGVDALRALLPANPHPPPAEDAGRPTAGNADR